MMILMLTAGYAGKPDSTVVKRTYQTAFTKTPPVIDGIGNEDAWNLVEWTSDFAMAIHSKRLTGCYSFVW